MDVRDRATQHAALDGKARAQVLHFEQYLSLRLRRCSRGGCARFGVEGSHGLGRDRAAHLAELRNGGEQHPRIVLARALEYFGDRTLFDNLASVHYHDAVRHLRHDRHVVRDEQDGHSVLSLQTIYQGENFRLDRHVESGGRFVGDQEPRLASHGHGNDDALAHSA